MQLVSTFCPREVQDIVNPYIGRSAYFAHPELLLLTLLASEQEQERHFAVAIVRGARKGELKGCSLPRKFEVPPINFEAQGLTELIDWSKVPIMEPLLTSMMTMKELEACLDQPLSVPATWQCHAQSMERAVKKVSDSCRLVVGREKREGWIRCAEESRRILRNPDTKADYEALFQLGH